MATKEIEKAMIGSTSLELKVSRPVPAKISVRLWAAVKANVNFKISLRVLKTSSSARTKRVLAYRLYKTILYSWLDPIYKLIP